MPLRHRLQLQLREALGGRGRRAQRLQLWLFIAARVRGSLRFSALAQRIIWMVLKMTHSSALPVHQEGGKCAGTRRRRANSSTYHTPGPSRSARQQAASSHPPASGPKDCFRPAAPRTFAARAAAVSACRQQTSMALRHPFVSPALRLACGCGRGPRQARVSRRVHDAHNPAPSGAAVAARAAAA